MPMQIIRRDGEIKAIYSYMMKHQARTALRNLAYELKCQPNNRNMWWRATNNSSEHLVCADLRSVNHADGTREFGMSVSEHTAYQPACGYRYIYPVTGEIAGTGSDGEPVLRNVVALDKPRTKPLRKWLDAQPVSQCPEWLTEQWINDHDLEYGQPKPDDEVLYTAW